MVFLNNKTKYNGLNTIKYSKVAKSIIWRKWSVFVYVYVYVYVSQDVTTKQITYHEFNQDTLARLHHFLARILVYHW